LCVLKKYNINKVKKTKYTRQKKVQNRTLAQNINILVLTIQNVRNHNKSIYKKRQKINFPKSSDIMRQLK